MSQICILSIKIAYLRHLLGILIASLIYRGSRMFTLILKTLVTLWQILSCSQGVQSPNKNSTFSTVLWSILLNIAKWPKQLLEEWGSLLPRISVNTGGTMLKTLFLYFGEFGVLYKHPSDFTNVRGAYKALLDHKFNEIAKERVDFRSLPNSSAIYISSFDTIENAI